jgi:transcriptional regulator with PAS, ATPase and Fis domain
VLTSGNPERDLIKKIGSHKIVVNALPIENEGRPQGAVALLKTVSRIESISRKFKGLKTKVAPRVPWPC